MKTCTKCSETKPLDAFAHKGPGRRRADCRDCHNRWRRETGAGVRAEVKRKYGLSWDEYQALLATPCDICGAEAVVVDHDHVTGKVRAGLCQHCNLAIGQARDNPAILRKMAEYLEHHA